MRIVRLSFVCALAFLPALAFAQAWNYATLSNAFTQANAEGTQAKSYDDNGVSRARDAQSQYNDWVDRSEAEHWGVPQAKDAREGLRDVLEQARAAQGYFVTAIEHYETAQAMWQEICFHCSGVNQTKAVNSRDSAYRAKRNTESNKQIVEDLQKKIKGFMNHLASYIEEHE
jgi:hypothetical protein